jgi:phage FluMu gp28-like protein
MHTSSDNSVRLRIAKRLWGWEAHPTQREWLLADARTKVASCGRRWGKTEAAAVDATTFALVNPGSVQMIVAPTYDQSRLIFGTVERLALTSPLTRGIVKVTRTPYPRLALAGSVIMARTADEDGRNLRGHAADRVIVDEAAYVRDSVLAEVIAPMLADRDGRLVMISTPFGKNHFYRAFVKGREQNEPNGGYAAFSFASWANPYISRQYIERQRSEISPRQFAVEYEAQFIDDASCVFAWEDIQAAVECGMGNAEWGMTQSHAGELTVVAGIDWARYSDYTAVVALGVSESGCRVLAIDRFNKMGWDSQIARVVGFVRRHRVSQALADSTSIGDPLLEQLRSRLWETGADVSVEGYGFTNASKRDLIEHLALKFAHRSLAIPPEEQLLRELQYFEYELTDSGNVRLNARSGMRDDLVIALALASWQSRTAAYAGSYLSSNGRVAARGW